MKKTIAFILIFTMLFTFSAQSFGFAEKNSNSSVIETTIQNPNPNTKKKDYKKAIRNAWSTAKNKFFEISNDLLKSPLKLKIALCSVSIPAIAGVFYVFKDKIFRNDKDSDSSEIDPTQDSQNVEQQGDQQNPTINVNNSSEANFTQDSLNDKNIDQVNPQQDSTIPVNDLSKMDFNQDTSNGQIVEQQGNQQKPTTEETKLNLSSDDGQNIIKTNNTSIDLNNNTNPSNFPNEKTDDYTNDSSKDEPSKANEEHDIDPFDMLLSDLHDGADRLKSLYDKLKIVIQNIKNCSLKIKTLLF